MEQREWYLLFRFQICSCLSTEEPTRRRCRRRGNPLREDEAWWGFSKPRPPTTERSGVPSAGINAIAISVRERLALYPPHRPRLQPSSAAERV